MIFITLGCSCKTIGCGTTTTVCPKCPPCSFYFSFPDGNKLERLDESKDICDIQNIQKLLLALEEVSINRSAKLEVVIKAYQSTCQGKEYSPPVWLEKKEIK